MRNRGLLLPFLLAFTACSSSRGPLVRTETVEVKVPAPVQVSATLTAVPVEPAAPAPACVDRGQPTLCNEQAASWLSDLRAWGRGLAEQLRAIEAAHGERP